MCLHLSLFIPTTMFVLWSTWELRCFTSPKQVLLPLAWTSCKYNMTIAMLHISKASLTPIGLDCLYITYTCIYMHMYMYWAASVAQLVKQLPSMQYVAGLNPIWDSSFFLVKKSLSSGIVALHCLVSMTDCSFLHSSDVTYADSYRKALQNSVINPRRTCTTRVTVLVLCVCLCVCHARLICGLALVDI